jgi:glycosyltransferase involved in cell wall biosynthesis
MPVMRFSIITPSFRGAAWLKLCIASVADQGVELEHIVQDAVSDDGTLDWLPKDPRVKAFVEKDEGMYDAVNRGLRRARGELLAYLNCDEQYLPGTLKAVGHYFEQHPRVEVAFADTVVTYPNGDYLCHRRSRLPQKYHSMVSSNLSILTAATFFRRSLIEQHRLFFDPRFRVVGDAAWVLQLLEQRVRLGLLPRLTSVFAETGANMSVGGRAEKEKADLMARAPAWARWGRSFIVLHYRLRRLLAGHYRREAPFDYSIYTRQSPTQRVTFHAAHPTFRFQHLTSVSQPPACSPNPSNQG